MSHTIAGYKVDFVPTDQKFHNWWIDYNPSTQVLPQGWKREEGRPGLREALIWDKDVPITLRDGTVLRADIFRAEARKDDPLPALISWSPYGKTGAGENLTTMFPFLGVGKESLSGLEKFEAPDPAEWCPRGYAVVQPDSRGCFHSEGDLFVVGTQVREGSLTSKTGLTVILGGP